MQCAIVHVYVYVKLYSWIYKHICMYKVCTCKWSRCCNGYDWGPAGEREPACLYSADGSQLPIFLSLDSSHIIFVTPKSFLSFLSHDLCLYLANQTFPTHDKVRTLLHFTSCMRGFVSQYTDQSWFLPHIEFKCLWHQRENADLSRNEKWLAQAAVLLMGNRLSFKCCR